MIEDQEENQEKAKTIGNERVEYEV